jgi:serine/threonine protein phosphatase PrpC
MDQSESEYVRGSECARIVIKTGQCINSMRDDIIQEKKKNRAYEIITKELSQKLKKEQSKNTMMHQELEYYKNKSNKKLNQSLSEQSLSKLLDKKDEYIMIESNKGVDDMVVQLRKQYL